MLVECPTCGAANSRDFSYFGAQELRRCRACDTVYAQAYADPSEVYVDGYLTGETEFGLDVRDVHFQRFLVQVGRERARLVERITGGTGRLLDVGCGTGEFAEAAQAHGFEVQAVEPEASSAEYARARGVDVRTAMLEESGLPEGHYDVVCALHVLEHLPDSPGFLATLGRRARPGGHVVVEVPNFASVLRRRSGRSWMHLRPLEHLVYHSPQTLERSFRRAGLEPVAIRAPTWVTPPQSAGEALRDLGDPPVAPLVRRLCRRVLRGDGTIRAPLRPGWVLLRAVAAGYDALGLGMVVFGVARVPGQ